MKRILAALLSLCFLLSMGGCKEPESLVLRMDIATGVQNLDPQFATDTVSRTIIANTFEGLLRKDEEGQLVPGVAQRYESSDNGLCYTFYLRRDAKWSDGTAVVADDFVFALQRIFHSQVPSPYAEEFVAIRNAREILIGNLDLQTLGVQAVDDYTLKIYLSQPDPLLPERLSGTAAMPCREQFFTDTRARYGLGIEYIQFNGPYRVEKWDNTKSIVLTPNSQYHDAAATVCPGIYFYIGRTPTGEAASPDTNPACTLFLQGKSDLYLASAPELSRFGAGPQYKEIKNKVWMLVFNTAYSTLDNENIRRALALSLDGSGYASRVPEMYGRAESLIPQSARPEKMPLPRLLPYDPAGAKAAAEAGLQELGVADIAPLTLLISQDAGLTALGGYLQKQWRDTLLLYGVNLEVVPQEQLTRRLNKKDFSLMLLPLEAAGENCMDVLGSFTTGSPWNYGSFHSTEYDALLELAAKASREDQAVARLLEAEQYLLQTAAAVPLFTQSSYYVFSTGTQGVVLVDGLLSFRGAKRMA